MRSRTIETDRLRIRPFRPAEDAGEMAAVYSDPEVMRYVADGALAPDAVESVPAKHAADNDAADLGFYAVEQRTSGAVDAENLRSLRLAERVGLRRREERVLHGRLHVIFER